MSQLTKKAFALMDDAERALLSGDVEDGLTALTLGFQSLRATHEAAEWMDFAKRDWLSHSLVPIIHQDPFTKHSFDKPRNYAGDAELIDYMYGLRQPTPETSELGKRIFDWGGRQSTTESVRERRKIIAAMIDDMATDSSDLRVLSVACGHLREAAISSAVTQGKVAEYFALDQDGLSLEVVKNEFAKHNVHPVHACVKSLFTNGKQFHDLDFVYAAGLFDYLPQRIANRLTGKMFQMLKPAGRLLVGNFSMCVRDIGYMETFMQWSLIYRTEAEVGDFAGEIPKELISGSRMFWDAPKNVIYLELVKR
jgi:SAM-dependent methyltransferase